MHKYLRYWYLFVIGVGITLASTNLYLRYYATPQYSISSTLLIKDDDNRSYTTMSSGSGDSKSSSVKNINDEIQLLKSKSLMHRVIDELSLNARYQVTGKVKDVDVYGTDSPIRTIISRIDNAVYDKPFTIRIKSDTLFELIEATGLKSSHSFGQQIKKPYGEFTVVATSNAPFSDKSQPKELIVTFFDTRKLAESYNRSLTVLPVNKDANVLTLTNTDSDPQRGKDIMNKLLDVYNKEALEDKNLLAANTLAFIDERLKHITAALSGVERNVEKFKRQNEVTDVNMQASNYMSQASDYNKKLSDWAIQIDILESIEDYLNKNANQYKMVPSTLGLQDQTLLELISKFNELQLERERMLRTAQANNPLVQNMNEQLGNLRVNILENLHNIKNGLVITSRDLKSNSGQFQERIKQVPSIERELIEINRQQATKQNIYLYLLQKREETALTLAARVSRSKVIDSATASNTPISPNPKLMYLLALLVGLGFPFTLIYVRDSINDKIQTKQDVKQLTATPILGELSHNRHKTVVVTEGSITPIGEMFGLIRAHLNTATARKPNKVLLVTSSMSGEGKTFFSLNLGASLAITDKKVLVLEMDFRAPNLLSQIGIADGIGISDFINSEDVSIADILSPVEQVANLFVAGAGSLPLNPAGMMTSPKLAYLIKELKVSFDYIIIDTAPVGQVADAFSLSTLVDTTIYLLRYNYTLKAQVELVDHIYVNKTLPNPLIVLNDAKKQNGSTYGYQYGYGKVRNKVAKVS